MDGGPQHHPPTQALLNTLAATGAALRLCGLAGDLADLKAQWTRHVREAEERLFPRLVAGDPAADGPVGFCLAEHAALSTRLAELESAPATREWMREAELLIGRLVQHLFLAARILQPWLDGMAPGDSVHPANHHPH